MALPLLTQGDFVSELADETGWTQSDVRNFLTALSTVLTNNLKAGNRVRVAGIQVECRYRGRLPERKGRNPHSGETITIAEREPSVVLKAKPVVPLTQIELPSVRTIQRLL